MAGRGQPGSRAGGRRRHREWAGGGGPGRAFRRGSSASSPAPSSSATPSRTQRVEYRVGAAEATGLTDASVDLLLAAQAFHWFRQRAVLRRGAAHPPAGRRPRARHLRLVAHHARGGCRGGRAVREPRPRTGSRSGGWSRTATRRWRCPSRRSRRRHSPCAARGRSMISSATWAPGPPCGSAWPPRAEPAGRRFARGLVDAWGPVERREAVWPLAVRAFRPGLNARTRPAR